ncbi:hypothetical protein GUJ93_ZPchr0003g17486 [Zizania palustris]|uniref:Uncharacterized protein n=1 Tax=Zizania palustris TaxID=103762 RepID=A0A8J5VE01_ZIZPA|nr:hypothetical protein GUJ93_ZPchr0003g17486 [Zizania palustris]
MLEREEEVREIDGVCLGPTWQWHNATQPRPETEEEDDGANGQNFPPPFGKSAQPRDVICGREMEVSYMDRTDGSERRVGGERAAVAPWIGGSARRSARLATVRHGSGEKGGSPSEHSVRRYPAWFKVRNM